MTLILDCLYWLNSTTLDLKVYLGEMKALRVRKILLFLGEHGMNDEFLANIWAICNEEYGAPPLAARVSSNFYFF
jgi:hypothetical protein